jgi:hypothetical protein
MLEINGGEVLLIVTAAIFALLFHLTSITRSAKIVGFTGCACTVLAALLDFDVISLGILIATLAAVLAIQMVKQFVRS